MNYEDSEFSKKLKNYVANLDTYILNNLFQSYTDRTVTYLKNNFKKKCETIGPIEYEGVKLENLYELYCIKCCYTITSCITNEHFNKFKHIFLEILDHELRKEEIEIMWLGHNSGNWFSFSLPHQGTYSSLPSSEKMKDDITEGIVLRPVLEDIEEKKARAVAERNRMVALPIYIQERCVLAGLKMPSFSLATEMTKTFALFFNDTWGNILESTGVTSNLSVVQGAIIPYIKFMGYAINGRRYDDDSPSIEEDDELTFYENNKDTFINLLDSFFYNYYLCRYMDMPTNGKKNFLHAVEYVFFETLQELGPELYEVNLVDESDLIINTFTELADHYTHIFALFLMGINGKEFRIRNEFATFNYFHTKDEGTMGFFNKLFGTETKVSRDDIFTLAIDEKFPIRRNRTGEEIRIEATGMGLFFIMYYSQPRDEEIMRIKKDPLSIYFTYKLPVLECVLQVGDDIWGDAPYSAALYHDTLPNEVLYPPCIYVCLVDADTEILKSMRIIGLPKEIKNFLWNVQNEQVVNNIPDAEYDKCINYIKDNVPPDVLTEMANCSVVITRNNKVTAFIWGEDGSVTEIKL